MCDRVYIVEDDEDTRDMTRMSLNISGFDDVVCFKTFEEALEENFSSGCLFLVDYYIHAPGIMSCADFVRIIRDKYSAKVILLSGAYKLELKAAEMGVDYLVKPYCLEELISLME